VRRIGPEGAVVFARKVRAKRGALLLGTALATLLAADSFQPSPASALDQIVIDTQTITLGDSKAVNNSSKLTTTLQEVIDNLTLARANSRAAANTNGANVPSLFQLIDLTQQILLNSDIDIANSGNIDPVIGIYAQINNVGIAFANSAAASNANGGSASGDITQEIDFDQINSVASSISKDNSGDIVADQIGIFAEINTGLVAGLSNSAAASNANGTAAVITVEDLAQAMSFIQTNTIASDIEIINSGDVNSGTGILAEINNQIIGGFQNSAAASNANGTASAVDLSDLSQSMAFDQANSIASGLVISQSGEFSAGIQGISTEIDNRAIGGFLNASVASNANGTAAAVTLGDLAQSFDIAQANTIQSLISIDNSGGIDADRGIVALIYNQAIGSFLNQSVVANANGSVAVVDAEDAAQTMAFNQENSLASTIVIANSAELNASDVGIQALIDTGSIGGFVNFATFGNANGGAAVVSVDSLTQSARVAQANTIASAISIENTGEIDPDTGIMAEIHNQSIGPLTNQVVGANVNGTAALIDQDDLTQSFDINQANTVSNNIAAVNTGKIKASDTGISALIDNQGLTLNNVASFANATDATSTVSGDLTQTADIVQTNTVSSSITITNKGSINAGGTAVSAQILNNDIAFFNQVSGSSTNGSGVNGDVTQTANITQTNLIQSNIKLINTGSIQGGTLGVYASISRPTYTVSNSATVNLDSGTPVVTEDTNLASGILIDNSGTIGAKSLFAIDTVGASTTIINRKFGVITGFVDLTEDSDIFHNRSGGTFEARLTSDFGGGTDLFTNAGTVHTAANPGATEKTAFVNLERFENSELISLQDHKAGDVFIISNTVGGTDLSFAAGRHSTLAVDAYLGGPGEIADKLIIQGDVTGQTALKVDNTNKGPGVYNPKGIPVAFVDGSVSSNAFFLKKPIETGYFDYDLFFVPTGSGFFELRSHPGGGAHVLPRLITATQDVFHTTSETWFDRTADLRVLLNGGAPVGADPDGTYGPGVARVTPNFTPAVWVKGSGTWLNQDDKETSTSFGRTYRYDLNRDLDIANFETGIDFGKRDLFSPGDMLVFGLLGGVVLADLDYDNLSRQFDISGGEAGAYATYLKGGLFVDTLFKAHFLEIEPQAIAGFPGSIDATTWGVRTDSGYRFGGFHGGAFIEPLATIAFAWNNLDDFVVGGNTIDFNDETNVRGRLGLRVGTSYQVWPDTTMEPFVIGSWWSTLSGDNQVTLTSTNTTFRFEDAPDDAWGVASAGVNFFNPSKQTSVFAKVDVTFGEETDGIAGRAGMRVSW
jgi:autotransporter family porin